MWRVYDETSDDDFSGGIADGCGGGTAPATEIAVVDAERILAQSTPGKKGQEHLNEVQKVLQKGYNDLVALYRGRENSPEAQEIIRQGQAALEQQMAVERNAVLAVCSRN